MFGRYGVEDLKIYMQLESVPSWTAERSTISDACDFQKDNATNNYSSTAKLHNFWQAI